MKQPFILAILDGWGYSKEKTGNPLESANLSAYNYFLSNYPNTLLQASGLAVGLPWGEAGNSEAGHVNMGAGRIVKQYSTIIDEAIKSGTLNSNPIFNQIKGHISSKNSKVHLIGLLTSGTVHASFGHIIGMIEALNHNGINEIYLHLFTDGKDSGLKEAPQLLEKLNNFLEKNKTAKIATLIGRNYAMDRDRNWNLTKEAYVLITKLEGKETEDFLKELESQYSAGLVDSKIPPIFNASIRKKVENNDAVVFLNFREDSMRQIVSAFAKEDFNFFPRTELENLMIITMTKYIEGRINYLFPSSQILNGLAETLSLNNKNHLHIAESEKYAHVTYFFNSFNHNPFPQETDIFIESFKDFESNPEMKSKEITDKVLEELNKDFYDFVVVNFANADLLAHTGNFSSAVMGAEAIDRTLSKLYFAITEKQGTMIITGDHGNIESMVYKGSGEKQSRHSINPVPFILVNGQFKGKKGAPDAIAGILADVAPTILELMGIRKPKEMTGQSLLNQLI